MTTPQGYGPQGYGQAGYPGGWSGQPPRGTNGLAIASLVLSILTIFGLGSVLGIVFGLVARRQTRDSGQGGAGLALAGLIVGSVTLLLCIWFWGEVIAHHGHYCTGTGTYCRDHGYDD